MTIYEAEGGFKASDNDIIYDLDDKEKVPGFTAMEDIPARWTC